MARIDMWCICKQFTVEYQVTIAEMHSYFTQILYDNKSPNYY